MSTFCKVAPLISDDLGNHYYSDMDQRVFETKETLMEKAELECMLWGVPYGVWVNNQLTGVVDV